ncbi:MAG: glycosyltransferase [Ruminiclostridium sp.]|nr:glycosyltransferase [Ruminiclostridium sp.]
MLLTIGMIVKNEEKYLERCLNGIKPILEQVDSELIIADTGSTDRTVEIAKQFTDNVFYFEWIKDFAAARNSTLEKAQGEWFMFVDADEIFEACDEIIHFFNSGEYKKYNSASYIVRNIVRRGDKVSYSDFRAPRMTKILPATKFHKPVHECFTTYGEPLKLLNDAAMHYGYANTSDSDEAKAKFIRNTEILMKRYENREPSPMLFIQLYDAFGPYEPEKADKFLDEGIEYGEKRKEPMLPVLYSKKIGSFYGDKKYEEALTLINKYYKLDKKIRPAVIGTDVDISMAEGFVYYALKDYEKAVPAFIRFFGIFRDFNNGKLNTPEVHTTARTFARSDNFPRAVARFVHSCVLTGKAEIAEEWLLKLPFTEYPMDINVTADLVRLSARVLEDNGFGSVEQLYGRFDNTGRMILRRTLFNMIFRVADPAPILSFLEKEKECADLREPARLVYNIAELRKKGDYRGCFVHMKKFAEGYPEMAQLISEYQKDVLKEYEAVQKMNEMQKLAAMIKTNIRNYIASGNTDAAAKTLAEYEKINPSDPEIAVLKAEIH